jgi:hypothetical protein
MAWRRETPPLARHSGKIDIHFFGALKIRASDNHPVCDMDREQNFAVDQRKDYGGVVLGGIARQFKPSSNSWHQCNRFGGGL